MAGLGFSDLHVGVLKGGVSEEREVSLISGKEAAEALRRRGINVVEIDITSVDEEIIRSQLLAAGIHVAFIALHGRFGEDGGIQKILEDMGIAYTGSSSHASYYAMDKIVSKQLFVKEGIPTPSFIILEDKSVSFGEVNFPVVIKPHYSGSSLGVSIVKDRESLWKALEVAFSISDKVIIEEYIAGRELTVGILDDKPLGVVEIVPRRGYYDFSTKYSDGMVEFKVPAPLDDDVYNRTMEVALRAHQVLGCRHFSRVDIRLNDKEVPFVLEVNSIPGLTSHSLLPMCAKLKGLNFDDLIVEMLKLCLRDVKKEKQRT